MNLILLLMQQLPQGGPEEINFGMLFLKMMFFLGLVVLLIYLFLKKVLPLVLQMPGWKNQAIKILERVPLDQKRSLLIVEIQEKVYLLGSAEGQINILMELDREKLPAKQPGIQKNNRFDEILKRAFIRSKS